jgi:hypothetical protein
MEHEMNSIKNSTKKKRTVVNLNGVDEGNYEEERLIKN